MALTKGTADAVQMTRGKANGNGNGMRIGFIGTGVITEAIVTGLIRAKFPVTEIVVSPRSQATAKELAAQSPLVRIGRDNQDVVCGSNIVFLAVRPQVAKEILASLHFEPGKFVVSLIATVSITTLQDWIGTDVDISRAVPLPFVADLNGVTITYPGSEVLTEIFSSLGTTINCETIEEFDALTVVSAVMGTYFGIAETCAQWLNSAGLPYDKARGYLTPFFNGLAKSALKVPDKTFEELRIGHSTVDGLNDQMFQQFRGRGGLEALNVALNAVARRLDTASR